MNIKRFFAKSSREALSLVRQQLGANAVIISSRAMDGGTEILAVKEQDMDQMINAGSTAAAETPRATAKPEQPQSLVEMLASKNRILSEAPTAPEAQAAPMQTAQAKPARSAAQPVAAPSRPAAVKETAAKNHEIEKMMHEIKSMRFMLQSQLTEMSWANIQQREPVKSEVLNMMLAAGFSAALSRQIAEKSPAGLSRADAVKWMKSTLARNLHALPDESEILEQGGVFALIGPTGVGKTTTTAKLAARFVMKHGANKLGLITTDAYRIGGHEQLRIYGKILGVMVHAVKDQADLEIALQELKHKHTILIDTVGVSQRDRMVTEQIAMLHGADTNIKKLLCLNATSTGDTLTDVMNAYKGRGLDGCIMTKLDEAATIGSALDLMIREKLKLYYVANGQRVPEDLHLGNKQFLMHHAFKLSQNKHESFTFRNDELPALMANTSPLTNKLVMETGHA